MKCVFVFMRQGTPRSARTNPLLPSPTRFRAVAGAPRIEHDVDAGAGEGGARCAFRERRAADVAEAEEEDRGRVNLIYGHNFLVIPAKAGIQLFPIEAQTVKRPVVTWLDSRLRGTDRSEGRRVGKECVRT